VQRGFASAVVFICFVFVAFSPSSFAQSDLSFSRNARTFETQQGSLITKALAFACLSLTVVPDGLPCNPAFTPFEKEPHFDFEGLISNGYPTMEKMRLLLSGNLNQDLVQALFGGDPVLQIEGNAELDFHSRYFNARYTPASVKFFSVVRNEANPLIDVYAVDEQNFEFQSGYEFLPGLFAGAQVRAVDRKYVRKQVFLLDLATDEGRAQLQPQRQSAVYFEPGVSYVFNLPWKPRISAMIVNLGIQNGNFSDMNEPIEGQYSIGINPELPWGDLSILLDYRSMNYQESSYTERLRLGMMYHLGAMYLGGGVDNNGVSGGLFFSLQQLNAGILYSTTRVPWQSSDFFTQTVYVEAGWRL